MRKLIHGSLSELVDRLRACGTRGEPKLKPYASAQISLEPLRISDLVPLAKYGLAGQLGFVTRLYERLSSQGEDIFNLECGILWPDGQDERPITCPIVEQWDNEGLLLVDGLHRVLVARDFGRTELVCAVARGVEVPLVPIPVTWNDVKVFPEGQYPLEEEKRTYRFASATALRTAIPELATKITEANFKYFLYRDLDELGSAGIRPPRNIGTSQ